MKEFDAIDEMTAQQLLVLMNIEEMQEMFAIDMRDLVPAMATWARDRWQDQALSSSAWGSKYASAIKIEYISNSTLAKVYVDESEKDARSGKPLVLFVNMTETGMKSFSIKQGLLQSDRVKVSSKGVKFIIVPFRQRIPGKQKPSSGFSGVMTQKDYVEIKKGGSIKTGKLAGLVNYNKRFHSQFFTFRAVSEKSKGWQHPGKSPTPVFSKVERQVDEMIKATIQRHIEKTLKERYR